MLVRQRGCVKAAHCLYFPGSLGQFDNTLIEHAFCQLFAVVYSSWFGNLFITTNISSEIFYNHDAREQRILIVFQKSYQRCIFTLQQKANKEIVNVTT